MNLLNLPNITAAITQTTTPVFKFTRQPKSLLIQANFVYGSGGTSVDAYVQTAIDGGTKWIDIAQFHLLLASLWKGYNLSSLTPQTTAIVFTDGTMAANTAQDGILGTLIRVKYASVGTYAGGTSLSIDVTAPERIAVQTP